MQNDKSMPKYKDREEQKLVTETMSDLLVPMSNHLDAKTKEAVQTALRLLSEIDIEDEPEADPKEKGKETAKYFGMVVLLNNLYAQGQVTKDEYESTMEKIIKEAGDKQIPITSILAKH